MCKFCLIVQTFPSTKSSSARRLLCWKLLPFNIQPCLPPLLISCLLWNLLYPVTEFHPAISQHKFTHKWNDWLPFLNPKVTLNPPPLLFANSWKKLLSAFKISSHYLPDCKRNGKHSCCSSFIIHHWISARLLWNFLPCKAWDSITRDGTLQLHPRLMQYHLRPFSPLRGRWGARL